ncbi:MAG: hypothetical protein V4510_08410 [bacterium]
MRSHLLSGLAHAGVLEYGRGRGGMALRASPRFLAHAEDTAARLGAHARSGPEAVLAAALASWDDDGAGLRAAAQFLADFLAERDQLGSIRPVFPVLEHFAVEA